MRKSIGDARLAALAAGNHGTCPNVRVADQFEPRTNMRHPLVLEDVGLLDVAKKIGDRQSHFETRKDLAILSTRVLTRRSSTELIGGTKRELFYNPVLQSARKTPISV